MPCLHFSDHTQTRAANWLTAQELSVWAHPRDSPSCGLLFRHHAPGWINAVLYGHSTASGSKEGPGGPNAALRAGERLCQKL